MMRQFGGDGKLRYDQNQRSIPIRGPVRMLSRDDPQSERPQMVKDAHVETFRLWDETQRDEYRRVVELVANERAKFGYFDAQWVPENKSWVVLVHWVEYYKEDPDRAAQKKLNL